MSLTTTCPYCNAVVPLSDEQLAAGRRIPCPRCGEAVPLPGLDGNSGSAAALPAPAAAVPSSVSRRGRNRLLGLGLVLGMAALATVVVLLLINTRSKRRLTVLAETEALGYLPDDTNVIATVNFAEAERTPEGKETIDRLGLGAGGSLDLGALVGLKREDVDVAVVGLRVDKLLPPRTRIVVQTKSDIDLDAVRDKLGARSVRKEGGREYYLFQVKASFLSLEFALWSPTARTLVAVYPADEFARVPARSNGDVQRFGAPIAELLTARPERDSFFWFAAHSDNWKDTSLGATLALLRVPVDTALVGDVRTLGLALRKESGVTPSRSRPARVTEESNPDPHLIALDLVLVARTDADMPALADAVIGWAERQKLTLREAERPGNRYSATIVGTPTEWERALTGLVKKK